MLDDRFWTKVRKAGPRDCWEWQANKNNKGYGLFRPGGVAPKELAHRLSYRDAFGHLDRTQNVMHSCDNPACVNPAHLQAGTQKQNMEDCARKERGGNTRLSASQVIALRRDYVAGMPREEIARRYGVSPLSLSDYTDGKSWRHLLDVPGVTAADLSSAKRRSPAAKLTAADIPAIRVRLGRGETCPAIARTYGVHPVTIHDIKAGRTWRSA